MCIDVCTQMLTLYMLLKQSVLNSAANSLLALSVDMLTTSMQQVMLTILQEHLTFNKVYTFKHRDTKIMIHSVWIKCFG